LKLVIDAERTATVIEHPDRCFAGHNAWNTHLEALGVAPRAPKWRRWFGVDIKRK